MNLPGGPELIIILFIVLLFFGAKKLPGLASSVGTSMKEFRHASREALDEDAGRADADRVDDRDAERTANRKPDTEG